ncbi:S-formylglutathione hydrolase FrmB [Mycolicibacterium moriokaense]|uniref:S-formylglutathione hydrolase FrmB n=1 Tax=Mycolicibacterium moriokaense TaxID=39691 RepID=A0A318H7C5_9MYCO|nr:alpha/beta hydrolase-fold protein [Mycolicibacterium moriokaense]PXX00399.1 S-formylglutathione hydrolase FrmB [Mycolicibacterium moriokaense]
MLDWSLLSGPVPVVLRLVAAAAGLWLVWTLLKRRRAWPAIAELITYAVAATAATVVFDYLARKVWMLFPDRLDLATYLWAGLAVFAVCLALTRIVSRPGLRRATVGVTAAVVMVAACANQINAAYGAYLTPRDALDMAYYDDIALRDAKGDGRLLPDVDPVSSRWSAPPGLLGRGKMTSSPIPAPASGFAARDAKIYLPPAYFTDPRPRLPVLVLLAGQPGAPHDWVSAGHLADIMDGFAARHHGLAPVVVVADGTGSRFGNPLCLDSRRGKADTYLAQDVPAWIKTHLTVDADPQSWAVGGVSYGGTCALQLATNHPDVYPTFLDISGSAEPTLGDRGRTVAAAFGMDRAAFVRVNPIDLLRAHRYPGSAAAIVVGAADADTKPDARLVFRATVAAGVDSHYTEVAGSHDWRAFSAALARELPWLAQHMGLIASAL